MNATALRFTIDGRGELLDANTLPKRLLTQALKEKA